MNKTFKTIWNEARRSYIVTNEAQKSHGKPSKCAVALAVAATAFLSMGAANAAYVEPGYVASNSSNVEQAIQSWETEEYKADWGLTAMNASKAYALGYYGQGVAVGVMDSGALLQKHPDLAGDRFHGSSADAHYGSTGDRYPQATDDKGHYEEGGSATESGTIDGNWIAGTNDSHGTHVTGTVGANRDGSEFHGVAWGADVWVGNTGGTDNTNYGPFQDYTFFYNQWKALADNLIRENGAERGGVINNSFGTNTRVVDNDSTGPDGGDTGVHFPTNTVSQTEYEYFLFKQMYGENPSFVDAAYDAVKGTNVVQVMTTGNRDFANPFYRPLYPYFNPEAEKNWIAVAGLQRDIDEIGQDNGRYTLESTWNEAGLAKYWTVTAPGRNIYGSKVGLDSQEKPVDYDEGEPYWGLSSGTSMAAPHVTGAMTVLMSRYQDMSAVQVRDVMFTTANHHNPDGTLYGDLNGNGKEDVGEDMWTAAEGEVDDRYGWGTPDLENGMYGLAQLLGNFDYNMATTKLDVWSNDISQVALDQREREELAWKDAAEAWLALDDSKKLSMEGLTADQKELLGEILLDTEDDVVGVTEEQEKVSEKDAIAWRTEYYNKRLDAINAKIEQGLYDGSLTKRGQGTLVLTGNNTYRGGTTVEEGTLLGFAESFGVTGDNADATANGKVTVNGGILGVMNSYNDTFTMTGEKTANAEAGHSVDITVNKGGSYGVVAGQDVNVGTLTFKDGAGVTVVATDTDVLKEAYNGKAQTGSVTAEKLEGADLVIANPDYAFFTTDIKTEGNKVTATLTRDEDVSVSTYASSDNGSAIANVIGGATDSAIFASMVGGTKDQVRDTLSSLDSDIYLSAQNASIVNSLSVARAVKDQAIGVGEGRRVEMKDGTARLWATGIGSWSDVDYGTSMDVDTYAGFVGGEVDVTDSTKVGVFFGYGSTDFDASHYGKIESDDIHFGIYGETAFELANVTYGIIHTNQDRDISRTMNVLGQVGGANTNADADITQVFAEAAYTGFNTESYAVEPYFGLSYMHVKTDSVEQSVGGMSFDTDVDNANLAVTTLGVRGAVPFSVGSVGMQVKGDVAWNHFFGDNEAEGKMRVADAGFAKIKGEKLDNMATVGLGVEAKLTKDTTFGLSYTGAFDGDITSHGVGANLRINF